MAIFVSVAIAFFFGMLVQWLARMVFTFNYKNKMKYSIALFGGIASTAIIYFMVIKGLKDSSFMTSENKQWVQENTMMLVSCFFVISTILMQILHWLKVNVFKVVVLLGTFALALAFAGNDLVNFIGVPLAGYSSFMDYTANGTAVGPDGFLMTSLMGSAKTPWYFLIGAGAIMVYALCTSKKAHAVIKTSVDLSRQDEGERELRKHTDSTYLGTLQPHACQRHFTYYSRKRQTLDGYPLPERRSHHSRRSSIRPGSCLCQSGTCRPSDRRGYFTETPLSTTYVTFMVAMGTSLADRAWGRDSAVYRITGVLSVIGGWFITAGAAFTICFFVAMIIHFGGSIAIIALIGLAAFTLIRSQLIYKKKKKRKKAMKP